ncbi:rRNA pseudouridine synthase [candidate division WOR-3 bacterium]|nr:rRNA pseudouridine synthase [candidate division WOR-3 bacterium]
MRIVRFLARAGISSRRTAAKLLKQGLIRVGGKTVNDPWVEVDPECDRVTFRGKEVKLPKEWTYLMLNKPKGVITTCSDKFRRPTALDLIDLDEQGLVPVGRLDEDSEGLLFIMNDGKLVHKLTHPSFEVEKEYKVILPRTPGKEIKNLVKGIDVGKDHLKAKSVRFGEEKTVYITLKEGKNREVRRMLGSLGYRVLGLIRVRIGNLKLGNLPPGKWRRLTEQEVNELKRLCYGSY